MEKPKKKKIETPHTRPFAHSALLTLMSVKEEGDIRQGVEQGEDCQHGPDSLVAGFVLQVLELCWLNQGGNWSKYSPWN